MSSTAREQFANAIQASGLNPPESIIADDKIHRFPSNGKKHGDDGWYVYHTDCIPAGAYGDWKSGLSETWRADIGRKMTDKEEADYKAKVVAARKLAEAEDAKRKAAAAAKAGAMWDKAKPTPSDHAYLLEKQIQPHGVRSDRGELLVPMYYDDTLCSIQTIKADASGEFKKKFMADGRASGCYFMIGDLGDVLIIAEGFATSASIHEATGHAVCVAFSAGNLLAVAKTMRQQYPDLKIILCVDDDHRTSGNPGLTKSTEAARAIGGLLAVPAFGDDRPEGATDFNDLARLIGHDAVKRDIANARAPDDNNTSRAANAATPSDTANTEWPALEDAALHGLPGDIVRAIAPHTEADPAALLVQTLIAFGSLIGRGCHIPIEGDKHNANLYAVLVGATAKGRKGTSWGRVHQLFCEIPGWGRTVSGLSSGEGLKFNVRDATEGKDGKGGDPGVEDKRLLVIEPEFAQVLRVASRPGNTLSATMRQGWDGGVMSNLTKNDPITATGAHISIVAHVTKDELRSELTETESGNGFANRFLFVCVKRARTLPFGGGAIAQETVIKLKDRIAEAKRQANNHAITKPGGVVVMSEKAMHIWVDVYATLSEGFNGLLGSVTARAESQVRRIAMIYALMDGERCVDVKHLDAALALWRYCEHSARFVFGSALGNRVADEILRALRVAGQDGMTRTEIRDLFKRHESAERIGLALDMLEDRDLAVSETRPTEGRPTQVWRAK